MELSSDGASPPLPADLDGDGTDELILATSDGFIHAFRLDGTDARGWPVASDPLEVHLGSRAFASGAVPVPNAALIGEVAAGDLDNDGSLEVVAADVEGKVYVWNAAGVRSQHFPVSTLPQYSNSRRSERDTQTPEGLVPDRTNRHTRDNRLGRGISAGALLVNLDASADGSLEIVVGSLDRHLYAWTNSGNPIPGWPLMLRDPAKVQAVDPVTNEVTLRPDADAVIGTKIIRSPSVGDLDGDGRPEIVAVVNEGYRERVNATFDGLLVNFLILGGLLDPGNTRVYAVHADGTMHGSNPSERGWNPDAFASGWPVKTARVHTELLPVVGTGSNGPPALADLDADGLPEIATFSAVGPIYLFKGNGQSFLGNARNVPVVLAQQPFGAGSNSVDAPTFGALGGPAFAELRGPGTGYHVVAATTGLGKLVDTALPSLQSPADNHLTAWSIDRRIEENFPRQTQDLQFFVVPVVADISGDGLPEVMGGSGVRDLHAVDINGASPVGWPKFTAGWTVSPPAVADFDGDSSLEVAHVTREGYLFVWRTTGDECSYLPWPHGRHDAWGTSNVDTDAKPPATARQQGPTEVADGSLHFKLTAMPGDDLFCGEATYDLRFAETPIDSEAAFEAATPAQGVEHGASGREPGEVVVSDPALFNRALYFALVVRDDGGNRSGMTDLGLATLPNVPTATATLTATATRTQTPAPSATPPATFTTTPTRTSTQQPTATQEPSATPPPTSTPASTSTTLQPTATPPLARKKGGDDGCAIGASQPSGTAQLWLLPAALMVLLRLRLQVRGSQTAGSSRR
jgi:hypothetical protein